VRRLWGLQGTLLEPLEVPGCDDCLKDSSVAQYVNKIIVLRQENLPTALYINDSSTVRFFIANLDRDEFRKQNIHMRADSQLVLFAQRLRSTGSLFSANEFDVDGCN
jgi:hypothetical protein